MEFRCKVSIISTESAHHVHNDTRQEPNRLQADSSRFIAIVKRDCTGLQSMQQMNGLIFEQNLSKRGRIGLFHPRPR